MFFFVQGGPEGGQQRSSFSPNYSMMPNQYGPGQFSPNSRFGMTGTPNRQNANYNNQVNCHYMYLELNPVNIM